MRNKISLLVYLMLAGAVFFGWKSVAQAAQPVVHAVLFFSPTCGSCHIVTDQVLPPLVDLYQDKLDIVGIDVSQPAGLQLYESAIAYYQIPSDRIGVPTLIIGDVVLVGANEIPQKLPQLIEQALQSGGTDFPSFPGLENALAAQPAEGTGPAQQDSLTPLFAVRFMQDPVANTIAVIVLLAMVATVIFIGSNFLHGQVTNALKWPSWITPVLCLAGLGVAGYLTYVETTSTQAICGPVGDCNSVQHSPYAYIFGILPVGVMGLAGYLAILAAWLVQLFGPANLRKIAAILAWGMALFGVMFSIYLTFLEPFVIGASCAWCLASALLITLLLVATTEPVKDALRVNEEGFADDDPEQQPLAATE